MTFFPRPVEAEIDACLVDADCYDRLQTIEGDCGFPCVPGAGVACHRACLERTLCGGRPLGDVVEPFTGDLRCEGDDGPEWSHPIFNLDPQRATGRPWALTCLGERQMGGETLNPECFDAQRWSRTMAHAAVVNRARASDGSFRLTDVNGARRLQVRLIQQWFELDAAISRELVQDLTLSAAIDNPGAGELTTRSVDAAQALLAGWDQILRPFPQGSTFWASAHGVIDPLDYRQSYAFRAVGAPLSMGQGLPVAGGDALIAQLDLIERIVSSANAAVQGGALDDEDARMITRLGQEAVRRAITVLSLFTAQVEEVRGDAQPWIASWDQSTRAGIINGMVSVRSATTALTEGTNPLGVSELDVPASFDFQGSAGREFMAISRYTYEQAARRLGEAEDSLDDAQAQWIAFGEQRAEERQALLDTEARADDIENAFGEEIAELCGLPLGEARRALSTDLNPESCYIIPDCRVDATARAEALTTAELGFSACYAGALRLTLGDGVTTGDAALNAQVDTITALVRARGGFPFSLTREADAALLVGDDGTELLRIPLTGPRLSAGTLVPITLPSSADPAAIDAARALCSVGRAAKDAERPGLPSDRCETADACPIGMICNGGACTAGGGNLASLSPACFRGELGRAALGVREARLNHQVAIARLAEHRKYFGIAVEECTKLREGHEAVVDGCISADGFRQNIAASQDEHGKAMRELRNLKIGLQIGAHVAAATQDCGDAANKGSGGAAASAGSSVAAAAVECGAAVVKQGLEAGVAAAEFAMENAEAAHAGTIRHLEDVEALRACNAEADQAQREFEQCSIGAKAELVGARASMLEVLGALEGLRISQFDLQRGVLRVQGLLEVGRAQLDAANRDVSPRLAPSIWLDEAIVDYQRDFARAQKVAYVAARAAEYETQKSIGAKAGIIAAGGVGDLEDALRALDDEVITPGTSVCGTAPNTLQTRVLSLRDDILALGSRVDLPDGWQTLSATDRLRAEMASPQNAVYENGQYLGQAVPFTLEPGVFAASGAQQCAERIWLLNVGLVGGGDASGVSLELRQRNTFYSQRCDAPGERVTGVVRPSRNLYAVEADFAPSRDDDRSRRAVTLRAFPRARDELQRLDSSNGQSIEYQEGFNSDLAGRGLYGDYELMIPAAQLGALQLDQLQDVLLRVDMVAEQPCPN